MKFSGKIHGNKGKIFSAVHRARISAANKGRVLTEEWKENIRKGLIGNPKVSHPHSEETKRRIGELSRARNAKGPKSPVWKGDLAGYRAMHLWVERVLGKPKRCEMCGKEGLVGHKIHWANISKKYKRDSDDWVRLCSPCHGFYDKISGRKKYARAANKQ